ncbi:hypothetical protein ANCCAN_20407 [Ancylostoma caninum]|uniref:Uncharacterized protein n=1 Tax=Ancylostoma caninum TaxID=29170 RepID=A0A368FNQ5_ANCCA|nr:hypothetical protein ANCCAN_20407 [Ancylostoma caninum]
MAFNYNILHNGDFHICSRSNKCQRSHPCQTQQYLGTRHRWEELVVLWSNSEFHLVTHELFRDSLIRLSRHVS